MYNPLLPYGLEHTRLSVLHYFLEFTQIHVHWVSDTIQPSHTLLPLSLPACNFSKQSFPMSHLSTITGLSIGVSASVWALPMNIQDWFPLGNQLVWSPCCPRDSQESSPAPQFKGISSSVFPLVYHPALTTLCDHCDDRSLDWTMRKSRAGKYDHEKILHICH